MNGSILTRYRSTAIAPRRKGSSLIETLAAMAVLGGAVLGIASLLLFSLRTQARAAERTMLASICRDEVETLLGLPEGDESLADGADLVDADVGRGHRRFARTWTVKRDAIEPGVMTIEVTARPLDPQARTQRITLGAIRTSGASGIHRDF